MIWRSLLVWLLCLQAQAGTWPGFATTSNGDTIKPTLSVKITPADADLDTDVGVYVLARNGSQWYTLGSGNRWTAWTGGIIPSYASTRFTNSGLEITILDGSIDITGLAGIPILVGYGRNDQDMLTRSLYDLVHVIGGGINGGQLYALQGNTLLRFVGPNTLDGSQSPAATITLSSLTCPAHAALDRLWDRLFIADTCGNNVQVIDDFSRKSGAITPSRTMTSADFSQPIGIAYDWRKNVLYVANSGNNSLAIIDAAASRSGNLNASRVVKGTATGLSLPYGLWSDADNNRLYVSNRSSTGKDPSIVVFEAAASTAINGNIFPNRSFTGSATRMVKPGGLTVDTSGNIILADSGAGGLIVFPDVSRLSGNNTPNYYIQGSATTLLAPGQPIMTNAKRLLVSDDRATAIAAFNNFPSRDGNIAPDAKMNGGATGLRAVTWIGIDALR